MSADSTSPHLHGDELHEIQEWLCRYRSTRPEPHCDDQGDEFPCAECVGAGVALGHLFARLLTQREMHAFEVRNRVEDVLTEIERSMSAWGGCPHEWVDVDRLRTAIGRTS